ncbi:11880_t:CDS:2 [Entrophospora sp. SA101]|nr:11880_t:CDS:2 [Entrophospora sp. SA101]
MLFGVIRFNHNYQLVYSSNGQLQQQHNQESLLVEISPITIHDQALIAFKKMYQVRVEAVAIVNDEISVADLCGLNRDHLNGLKKPVIMFLKSTKGALIKPLTCHQKITLSQILCIIRLIKLVM